MKRPMLAAVVACGLLLAALPAAMAQAPATNPQVEVRYLEPRSDALKPVAGRLRSRKVLEEFAQFLIPIKLPKKLIVQFDQCDAPTRYFTPGGPATVCYELVNQIEQVGAKITADNREMVLVGTVVQAVFHEGANAIFDVLQVPLWGRREDAADRLSGFLMVESGSDNAYRLIIGTAMFFQASGQTWTGSQFADVNSPQSQRFFNFLCMAYGGDPVRFSYLARPADKSDPIIPKNRASQCKAEFTQVRSAFNLRIMPYIDPELLVGMRATQWSLTPQ